MGAWYWQTWAGTSMRGPVTTGCHSRTAATLRGSFPTGCWKKQKYVFKTISAKACRKRLKLLDVGWSRKCSFLHSDLVKIYLYIWFYAHDPEAEEKLIKGFRSDAWIFRQSRCPRHRAIDICLCYSLFFAKLGTNKINSHSCICFIQIALKGFLSMFSLTIKLSCYQYVFKHNTS